MNQCVVEPTAVATADQRATRHSVVVGASSSTPATAAEAQASHCTVEEADKAERSPEGGFPFHWTT